MKLVSLCTPNFWPGLRVLAHSLKHRGGLPHMVWYLLSETGHVPDEWAEWLDKQGFLAVGMPFAALGQDRWPKKLPEVQEDRKHLEICFQRLRFFLLPPDEYIWLDTDMLCVNPATDLLYTKAISACGQFAYRPHPTKIATGLVRFDPDPDLFDECIEELGKHDEWRLPDQTVLNYVLGRHPEKVHLLPYHYDMVNHLAIRHPNMWKPEIAMFLPFAGAVKPWMGTMGDVFPNHQGIWNRASNIWRDYEASISSDA